MTDFKIFTVFILTLTCSYPVAAKTYKWVDDKGVTHYGQTIPPEYSGKDRIELDSAGRVIKKEEVLTPEERRAQEQTEIKKREEEKAAMEHKRRDQALINTYSNEKEIDLARNRNLQQIETHINSINSQLKIAENNLAGLKKESDGYTKTGKPIPASLQEDLKDSQSRLSKLQQDMDKAKAEKAVIDSRFDADKARYRELTGK